MQLRTGLSFLLLRYGLSVHFGLLLAVSQHKSLTIFRTINAHHFRGDLYLLGLLILLHLPEHRNLGNLIEDMHLKNLRDFLQSVRHFQRRLLHFRIVGACVWVLPLQHNWDVVNFFPSTITVFDVFCVVGTCVKTSDFHGIERVALPMHSARFEFCQCVLPV